MFLLTMKYQNFDHEDLSRKIENWFVENHNPNKEFVRKIIIEKYNPMNQIKTFTKVFTNDK